MPQNNTNQIPAMFWVYALLPFIVIAITLTGIKTHNPYAFFFIAVIPIAFLLVNRLDLWLVIILAISASRLQIPGMLSQLELVHVMIAGLTGVVFLRHIIRKRGVSRMAWEWRFIYLFAAVLLLTMAVRGTGFRFLGDDKWGGMRYVQVFLLLAFPFVVTNLQLSVRQWKIAIVTMSVMALIPTIADAIFVVSNGRIYHQYFFIQHGAVHNSYQSFGTGAMTRFNSAGAGGGALIFLPFILFPFAARNYWKYAAFVVAGLGMIAISGHRMGIINAGLFLSLFALYVFKGRRMAVIATMLGVGLVGLAVLMAAAPKMPLAIQRSISFIPFVQVDPSVRVDAAGSIQWRINVWENALDEIPNYLLVGKGYTFDPYFLSSPSMNMAPEDWAHIQTAYHNGPLSLLIGMGVVGFLAGVGFLIAACWRHFRLSLGDWHDPTLHRFYLVFMITLIVQSFVFLTLYGDVYVSFPGIFKLVGILEGLLLADWAMRRDEVKEAEALVPKSGHQMLRPSSM